MAEENVRQMQRAGTSAQWAASTVVPLANELCYDSDEDKWKLGNGTDLFTALSWHTFGRPTITAETPTGDMDGVNDTYMLSVALGAGVTTWGFYNVQLIVEGEDYTRSGATITLTTIRPNVADSDSLRIFG